jgi:hypothetical protein
MPIWMQMSETPTTKVWIRRRRDWLGWPQRCGTVSRGPGRGDFGETGGQARQEGEGLVMGWGGREGAISIGWRERPGLVGG